MSITISEINKSLKADLEILLPRYDGERRTLVKDASILHGIYRRCSALNKLGELVPSTAAEHKRAYLIELAADAVGISHATLSGDLRGARFYLRSVIENLLRHFYYFDHLIEYEWVNSPSSKFYMEQSELRDYAGKLRVFKNCIDLLASLGTVYSSLSRSVHTERADNLTLRKNLTDIALEPIELRSFLMELLALTSSVITLLFVFHSEFVNELEPRGKRWLTDQLTAECKAILAR
jgi:hypothetical protein